MCNATPAMPPISSMQRLRNKRKRATVTCVASAASVETPTQDEVYPTSFALPSEQTETIEHTMQHSTAATGELLPGSGNNPYDGQNVKDFKPKHSIATILHVLQTHMSGFLTSESQPTNPGELAASGAHNMLGSDASDGSNVLDVQDKSARTAHREKRVAERVKQIINETPFIHMLSSMAKPHTNIHIPLISRKYEEKFMRACVNMQERPCSMNTKCECMFIDVENAFVGTRFLIPNICGEQVHLNTMCILCLRKHTLLLFYKTMHAGYDPGVVIQRYGNICNEPGEYAQSAMIFANPNGPVQCMPLPIVAHQRNRYTVVRVGGVPHLRQHGVDVKNYPEPGFRVPPAEI